MGGMRQSQFYSAENGSQMRDMRENSRVLLIQRSNLLGVETSCRAFSRKLPDDLSRQVQSGAAEDITDLTEFEWAEMFVFGPYYPNDAICKTLNLTASNCSEAAIKKEVDEGEFLLVFTNGGTVSQTVRLPRNIATFDESPLPNSRNHNLNIAPSCRRFSWLWRHGNHDSIEIPWSCRCTFMRTRLATPLLICSCTLTEPNPACLGESDKGLTLAMSLVHWARPLKDAAHAKTIKLYCPVMTFFNL